MASVFTEHVRHFNSPSDPVEQVLPELERLLRRRMSRRNLLAAPASYLGYGPESWDVSGAFDDIVQDCYRFAVLSRIESLREQLHRCENLDGLITRNIDNFLTERQRRRDPIGYAVFKNVEAAARVAELQSELQIEGGTTVKNQSVLRLAPSKPRAQVVPSQRIDEALEEATDWEHAVSILVTVSDEGQDWIRSFLGRLCAAGVAAVRVGDFTGALAKRARASWTARHAVANNELSWDGDDEVAALVRMIQPDTGVDERDRWEQLKKIIPECIARLDRQQRVRQRLAKEFSALAQFVDQGHTPKQADLIKQLGVARATLSDDMQILGDLLRDFNGGQP